MVLALLLAVVLGPQAGPWAQQGPRESFIICPGHPRCPPPPRPDSPRPPPPAGPGETVAPGVYYTNLQQGPPGRVYFATGSTSLDSRARAILDQWVEALHRPSQRAARITIEGHADARGSAARNLALAGRRAAAVHDYLARRGVGLERMTTISFGEERPALYDSGESVWMMNRRVEIHVR